MRIIFPSVTRRPFCSRQQRQTEKLQPQKNFTLSSFETNEGKATLEVHGNDLLILEGYDDKVSEKAREVLLQGMSLPESAGKSTK